ncbi:MAG: hypothetical protein GX640_03830 [Fibrobacter sp.]|nr:hypothetical protein [Fibrobacter sp.]
MAGFSIQSSDLFAQKFYSSNKTDKNKTTEQTDDEKEEVRKLKERDREVRAHEMAHMAAGGGYVRGGASYSFQSGPDGQRYAVGGEVAIDTSPVRGDPAATVQKMQVVKRAALSPANPSGQDRAVAAAASAAEAQARQELASQNKQNSPDGSKNGNITNQYSNRGKSQISDYSPSNFDTTA